MDYAPKTTATHMDLVTLMTYYHDHLRPHSTMERKGVIKAMQRCLAAGLTLADLWQAVRVYEQDPCVQQADTRMRKSMRSFFTVLNVREWQRPIVRQEESPQLTLQRLTTLGEKYRPAPQPFATPSDPDTEL